MRSAIAAVITALASFATAAASAPASSARPASSAVLAPAPAVPPAPAAASARVKPGIEVLQERDFAGLKGRRVALLTNPSGVDRNLRSTIDILFEAPDVHLVRLFGPEHGVRGDAYAGDETSDSIDEATGLKVYSLYGRYRQPTPSMLEGLDVVVYDIQDVGARSYTFISTLGLMMRSCAEAGVEVMVLDRPNPLGGLKVEGPCVRDGFFSFVGQYRIPYIYGLTVGELAMLINEEGLNRGQKGDLPPLKCKLTVIPMEGWSRDMTYMDTGLPWILPSPNIPYPQTAVNYPCAGLVGECPGYLNIGIGYTLPFGTFAAEWIDAARLKYALDCLCLPGVAFREIHYKPFFGSKRGTLLHGVQYEITDYEAAELTLVQFYVMQALHELYPEVNPFAGGGSYAMFDKVCGSDQVRKKFSQTFRVDSIREYWDADVEGWKALSRRWMLY